MGRSNCDHRIANKLRRHYGRPYFLPNDSESIRTDWIFMGTPNNGAHMHVSLEASSTDNNFSNSISNLE